jgi:hypothetical protein
VDSDPKEGKEVLEVKASEAALAIDQATATAFDTGCNGRSSSVRQRFALGSVVGSVQ